MKIHITPEDLRQWEIESQEPEGELVSVTIGDVDICEGMGCYTVWSAKILSAQFRPKVTRLSGPFTRRQPL